MVLRALFGKDGLVSIFAERIKIDIARRSQSAFPAICTDKFLIEADWKPRRNTVPFAFRSTRTRRYLTKIVSVHSSVC